MPLCSIHALVQNNLPALSVHALSMGILPPRGCSRSMHTSTIVHAGTRLSMTQLTDSSATAS